MHHHKTLIFVPCYNCAQQVGRVLAQLEALTIKDAAEILVVDNGSSDGTADAAIAASENFGGPPVKIVRNRANYNLGGSHKAAFSYAAAEGFTHVLVLHGDDQGNVNDILPILRNGGHQHIDAVLGARFMPGSRLQGYSTFRRLGNRIFNVVFGLVVGRQIYDLGSGLNVFGRTIFTDPDVIRYSDDLRFNIYLLLDAIGKKRSMRFVPISWREDDQVSNVKLVSQTVRTAKIAIEFLLRRSRFRSADHRDNPRASYEFEVLSSRNCAVEP